MKMKRFFFGKKTPRRGIGRLISENENFFSNYSLDFLLDDIEIPDLESHSPYYENQNQIFINLNGMKVF